MFRIETWQQRLEAIEEEIVRMNDKIKKLDRRILELKYTSMDVGVDIALQLSSFPHNNQIIERLFS